MAFLLNNPLTRWIGAALMAVAAFVGVYAVGRREGAQNAEKEGLEDAAERVQKGRDALRDNRGGDAAERLRKNDGEW